MTGCDLLGLVANPSLVIAESGAQLNMRGVFLHVLGDALGSVIVVVSALVIKFTDSQITYLIDPVLR